LGRRIDGCGVRAHSVTVDHLVDWSAQAVGGEFTVAEPDRELCVFVLEAEIWSVANSLRSRNGSDSEYRKHFALGEM
jgi:hypothetical protein